LKLGKLFGMGVEPIRDLPIGDAMNLGHPGCSMRTVTAPEAMSSASLEANSVQQLTVTRL
jgi:hypothetical protein